MSTEASSPAKDNATSLPRSPENKGKAKAKDLDDVNMEEEEEEDEEEEEEEDEEEDGDVGMDEDEEEEGEGLDPSAILPRRTRGARIDYSSKEALEKAGLTKEELDHDEEADH